MSKLVTNSCPATSVSTTSVASPTRDAVKAARQPILKTHRKHDRERLDPLEQGGQDRGTRQWTSRSCVLPLGQHRSRATQYACRGLDSPREGERREEVDGLVPP